MIYQSLFAKITGVAIFCLACFAFSPVKTLSAPPLAISNQTDSEIINILVSPISGQNEFFIRLDLAPGQSTNVENPECEAFLRVDTGLSFWFFKDMPLEKATRLEFCAKHPVCILIDKNAGEAGHYSGEVQSLIPAPGEKIVCELSQFHPAMAMSDVCQIIPEKTPVDDNGAFLTGLGFGGKIWAGRLAPNVGAKNMASARLEHMELRRPFSEIETREILEILYKQGYAPWQAEFPQATLDFANMPDENIGDRRQVLNEELSSFFAKKTATGNNSVATIMLAPANMLSSLANADEPERDVQLFTLILQPQSGVLTLDVAAYQGQER